MSNCIHFADHFVGFLKFFFVCGYRIIFLQIIIAVIDSSLIVIVCCR